MCHIDGKLTNGLIFLFLFSRVLPDDTRSEILVLKLDATKSEAYLAPCHNTLAVFVSARRGNWLKTDGRTLLLKSSPKNEPWLSNGLMNAEW